MNESKKEAWKQVDKSILPNTDSDRGDMGRAENFRWSTVDDNNKKFCCLTKKAWHQRTTRAFDRIDWDTRGNRHLYLSYCDNVAIACRFEGRGVVAGRRWSPRELSCCVYSFCRLFPLAEWHRESRGSGTRTKRERRLQMKKWSLTS